MRRLTCLALSVSIGWSCSGGPSAPASPTSVVSGGATGSATRPTVMVTSTGLSPREIKIAVGMSVTFVNADTLD